MKRQAFQPGEIRDEQDNIIRPGAYGKKTALATSDNMGVLDYIINNFQALFDMISGACVYVDELPTSGDTDKLYVVKSTGKTYRWDGKQFILVSEAVDGLSAYEIAKQNGFTGTEKEWLESIRGEKGESITGATVDSDGYLILTLSTDTTIKTALKPLVDAKQYADNAAASATQARESEANAATSLSQVKASASQASASASDAASSAAKAKQSETSAANSESNALQYKNAANDSKTAAATSATNASKSEVNAKASANSATSSATASSTSADNAKASETHAATSETNAKQALAESQKIQKEVKSALTKVTGFAKYAGSVDNYSDLPSTGMNTGDVWNIVNADSNHQIKAGDNVIWNGKAWDNLSGFVDLSNYPTNEDVAKAVIDTTYSGGTITFIHKDGTKSTATIGDTSHATKADQDGEGNVITDTYYKKSDASAIHTSIQNQINTKQDKLIFDTAPTAGSANPITSGGVKNELDKYAKKTEVTEAGYITKATLIASLPVYYGRSAMWGAAKNVITVPDYIAINIGNKGYIKDGASTINVNTASNWDDSTYATSTNRAGKDFYIYACQASGTAPKFVLSANSTVPSGYTATNSRKIGGFHCECADVGTIDRHPLSGYIAGDILPRSIWDLKHRPVSSPEGMVWCDGVWVDIYLAGWDGSKLVSQYGAVIQDGNSEKKWHGELFNEEFHKIKKRLLWRDEFAAYAKGSNEKTNIVNGTDPNTTGGHKDTAYRRMISNYGLEDCCGVLWQWMNDIAMRGTVTNGTDSDYTDSTSYWLRGYGRDSANRIGNDDIDGDKTKYGNAYGLLVRLLAGGYWDDGALCGSRSVYGNSLSAGRNGYATGRGASEPLVAL